MITYYQEELPPGLSYKDYDAIGFDSDHCLTRYNVPKLIKFLYDNAMELLVLKKNYPKFLMNIDEKIMGMGLNYSVLDIKKGNVLKLGVGKRILMAYHGYSKLTSQ